MKRKFKILSVAGEFSIDTQVHLVLALLGLFNYIRQQEGIDPSEDSDDIEEGAGDEVPLPQSVQSPGSDTMNKFREKITTEMWKDYCNYIGRAC